MAIAIWWPRDFATATRQGHKIIQRQITRKWYKSKDRALLTMAGRAADGKKSYIIYRMPFPISLTQISRARHYSSKNISETVQNRSLHTRNSMVQIRIILTSSDIKILKETEDRAAYFSKIMNQNHKLAFVYDTGQHAYWHGRNTSNLFLQEFKILNLIVMA